ncbi:MAG TPA: TerC family protein [Hyphomicrobiaceae bacterium]|jgi:YjbE family integral membrane protein|nr:TerC family protein [Hyphomicrobiaceae bacterium]
MEALHAELIALAQVIIIDLVLAGDNAIVVGIAASRVAPELQARVIFWGIVGAVALRVTFAAITVQLLSIVGLTLAGGILLLWVCWKVYREVDRELSHRRRARAVGATAVTAEQKGAAPLGFWSAMLHIILADLSMSLDNVLAVAGAARDHTWVLVVGLGVSILLMAVAANLIAKLLSRFPWLAWLGLLIILYVAVDMIWRGTIEVTNHV